MVAEEGSLIAAEPPLESPPSTPKPETVVKMEEEVSLAERRPPKRSAQDVEEAFGAVDSEEEGSGFGSVRRRQGKRHRIVSDDEEEADGALRDAKDEASDQNVVSDGFCLSVFV